MRTIVYVGVPYNSISECMEWVKESGMWHVVFRDSLFDRYIIGLNLRAEDATAFKLRWGV